MCTVTFVPLENGFVLTSNRDENPHRKTIVPQKISIDQDISLVAPLDAEKGGTWIAMDKNSKRIACLLNGARKKHTHDPPYIKSRGRIVLEAFLNTDFKKYAYEVTLGGIEPFTLILADAKILIELVWNGKTKEINQKNIKIGHIWASSTLYDPKEQLKRRILFKDYLKARSTAPSAESLLTLHGVYGSKDFILNRENVKTVSITQVILDNADMRMHYYDRKCFGKLKPTHPE